MSGLQILAFPAGLWQQDLLSIGPICKKRKQQPESSGQDPSRADEFLTALRHAIVLDCRPATHFEEILLWLAQFREDV